MSSDRSPARDTTSWIMLSPLEMYFGMPRYDHAERMWRITVAGDIYSADSVDGCWRMVQALVAPSILRHLKYEPLPSVFRQQAAEKERQAKIGQAKSREEPVERHEQQEQSLAVQNTPPPRAAAGFGRGRPITTTPNRPLPNLKRGASSVPDRQHTPPVVREAPLRVKFATIDRTLVAQRKPDGRQEISWRNNNSPARARESPKQIVGTVEQAPPVSVDSTLQQVREQLRCHKAVIEKLEVDRDRQTARADNTCVELSQKEAEITELKKNGAEQQKTLNRQLIVSELGGQAERIREYIGYLEAYLRTATAETPLNEDIVQRHLNRLTNVVFSATQKLNSIRAPTAVEDKPTAAL